MDDIRLESSYRWAEARAAGVTRSQIRQDGERIARALYLSRAVDPDLAARCRAWMRVLPAGAASGLHTATALLGMPTCRTTGTHVVLSPRRVLPQRAGLTVHTRALLDEDVSSVDGIPVTSAAQTFLDMAAHLFAGDLLALGDGLARAGRLDARALERRLARAGRVRGVVSARAWAPHVSAGAGSRPESTLRYWLLTSDLPAPEVQVPILDGRGRQVAHADLGYARWKVALEYEGRQHAEHEQFGRDIDRYSLMAADGWLTLRFAARHLSRPWAVVDRTRRALLSRGWRPGRS